MCSQFSSAKSAAALQQGLAQAGQVDAGGGEASRLDQGDPVRPEQQVDRLGDLAVADLAQMRDVRAERGEHGAHALEHGRIAADQSKERAGIGGAGAARDRRIQEAQALGHGLGAELRTSGGEVVLATTMTRPGEAAANSPRSPRQTPITS